jgi:hypothetical protein
VLDNQYVDALAGWGFTAVGSPPSPSPCCGPGTTTGICPRQLGSSHRSPRAPDPHRDPEAPFASRRPEEFHDRPTPVALDDPARRRGACPSAPPRNRASPPTPDGTIPAALVARGAAGHLEPGFPVGHLAVSWSGAASGGTVRFRTATGWGPWLSVATGCTAGADRDDGRGRALVPAGGALGVELDPEPGADVRTLAINTTDGPRRTAARRAVPTDPPPGVRRAPATAPRRLGGRRVAAVRSDGIELFPPRSSTSRPSPCTHRDGQRRPHPGRHRSRDHVAHTVAQNFGDIGYHLLVDQQGGVYEGAGPGLTRCPCSALAAAAR